MPDTASDARVVARPRPGFFSSASNFSLPLGSHVAAGEVRGYYIDMRVKAHEPVWPPPWMPASEDRLHVGAAQWALGSYEHYLAGEGEEWLEAARSCADELVATQEQTGLRAGGWLHLRPFPHTFPLRPPWMSAMIQGEAASLLVRLYLETKEERYAEAASRALLPFQLDAVDGGVRAALGEGSFPEEYPTNPPSHVLNGGIFAIWGLHDVGVGLDEPDALSAFHEAVDTLAGNLHRWDLGYWSRYDLFSHPVPNVASSFYHDLHVKQLQMTHRLAPRLELAQTAERWTEYESSSLSRGRAFAGKAFFRIVVPRSRLFAHRLPWSAMRSGNG